MTVAPIGEALSELTEIQREAVEWSEGPLLVLAGPGSGKTQVLTCRIAELLRRSEGKLFRILALTFTNKAADEMRQRVSAFVPGLEERAVIGTFHSFCGNMLRQHGVHLGIKPDFAIYSSDSDRKAVLEDALGRRAAAGEDAVVSDARFLVAIDRLKSRLIGPDEAASGLTAEYNVARIQYAYRAYEAELRRLNALDFNSLVFEAHRLLVTFPAIANRYRRSYPYWLVDEFQDTNRAQYEILRALAGDAFANVFAVADDDQIIYEWNGASYRQIQSFLRDFGAAVLQLPTNYRCPAAIVKAANRLVAYNAQRTATKAPLIAGKTRVKYPAEEHLQLRVFETEEEEAKGIATEIAVSPRSTWSSTAVLARTRMLLDRVCVALTAQAVPAAIAQRRDEFISPEFRWLMAVLQQLVRPLDRRNFSVLIESFNRMAAVALPVAQVMSDAEATGRGYLQVWLPLALESAAGQYASLLQLLVPCAEDVGRARIALEAAVNEFDRQAEGEAGTDLREDVQAWKELSRDISQQVGRAAPLEHFLQELQLRSKAPSPGPETVTLMTVHGAKGREFDLVYVVGLAEDIMPSFQSRQKGDKSAEMEEERRNCFVAITRTKERLVLSRAKQYRGWQKPPSRFLLEMGLIGVTDPGVRT